MPIFIYDEEKGYWTLTHARALAGLNALKISRVFNPENLRRRCAALSGVLMDPDLHTARMARWLVRAARRGETQSCRVHPLRVGAPPGASKRQKQTDPQRQALLSYLTHLARAAIFRCLSP